MCWLGHISVRAALAGLVAAGLIGWAPLASAACNKAITVTETQQINYGTIAVTSGSGTVTISPSGSETAPAGYVVTGVGTAGTFLVTGTNSCTLGISFTPGSLAGPGAPMTITNFTNNAGATPTLAPAGGQLTFSVGADLLVNAGQVGGSYSGTYTVTVIYN